MAGDESAVSEQVKLGDALFFDEAGSSSIGTSYQSTRMNLSAPC
jgi:hypothetical protein